MANDINESGSFKAKSSFDEYFKLLDRNSSPDNNKIDYTFEGLIPSSGVGLIVGERGAAKSQLVMRMAACLATGEPLAYPKATKPGLPPHFATPLRIGATLLINCEGNDAMQGRTWSAEQALSDTARASLPPEFKGQLPIITFLGPRRLLTGANQLNLMLERIALERKRYEDFGFPIRQVFFDTLIGIFDIHDENNNSEMQRLMFALNQFSLAFNCPAIGISHPSKSGERKMGDSRGASAVINAVDFAFQLAKINASEHRTLTVTKSRNGASEGIKFGFKTIAFDGIPALVPAYDNDKQASKDKTSKNGAELTVNRARVLKAIQDVAFKGIATKKNISEQLYFIFSRERKAEGLEPIKSNSLGTALSRGLKALAEMGKISFQDKRTIILHEEATIENNVPTTLDTSGSSDAINETVTCDDDEYAMIKRWQVARKIFRSVKLPNF